MINIRATKLKCKEDISLIQNYKKAINDKINKWDCHHRLGVAINVNKMKEMGIYFHRPAIELIFLLQSDHLKLHHKGMKHNDETKEYLRQKALEQFKTEEAHKKTSEATKLGMQKSGAGKKVSKALKDHIIVNNGIKGKYIWPEELEHYLELGYVRGRIYKRH